MVVNMYSIHKGHITAALHELQLGNFTQNTEAHMVSEATKFTCNSTSRYHG